MGTEKKSETHKLSASFKVGAIALAFLIIGYQVALFVHSAAVARLESHRDAPDTVYVVSGGGPGPELQAEGQRTVSDRSGRSLSEAGSRGTGNHRADGSGADGSSAGGLGANTSVERRYAQHSARAGAILDKSAPRRIESFPFDPNTASIAELKHLGFSEKQAASIDNYRRKGGRFRRPEDFAKSYVVADSVFERLRPYIRIPKTDLNAADSAAFDALPGIGPYFASKMLSYRQQLGGYSYPEQLMDIWNFDQEKYSALADLIEVGPCEPFELWTATEEELRAHPYIGKYAARGIVLFRENHPAASWSVTALREAGILSPEDAGKLARCRIAAPRQ